MRALISEIVTVFLIAAVLQGFNYIAPLSKSDIELSGKTMYTEDVIEKKQPKIKYPIDINLATKSELMTLSGIGEKTADKIIQYREHHGEFKFASDIMQVNGIGSAKYDKIASKIYINNVNFGEILEK